MPSATLVTEPDSKVLREMARLRFVHAADLHLDSPFTGLKAAAPENVAKTLYGATFAAYENIIDLCISERVDALLIAGDVYDSADRSLRAQRKFVDGLERLHDAGIRSFVCHGNHDPLNGWEARLSYPSSCHRFGPEFEAVPVFEDEPGRAVVHGISYPQRDVTENLVRRLGKVEAGPFSIGLLHANVDNDPNHPAYAPCTIDDLVQAGVDYWALGHVHTRRVLNQQGPTVVYPGNPQGRHPNETGPRGVYLVDVDDFGQVNLDFRPMDTVRWERLNVNIVGMDTEQDLLDDLHQVMEDAIERAEQRSIVVRITLSGRGTLHSFLRRSGAMDSLLEDINDRWAEQSPFAWCERIEDETASPFNRQERIEGSDFVADLLRLCDQSKTDPELLTQLRDSLSDLYDHRTFARYLKDSVPSDNDMAVLIDEAESIAVNLLVEDDPQ